MLGLSMNKRLCQRTLPGLLVALAVFVCDNTVSAWNVLKIGQDTPTELRLSDPVSREMSGDRFSSFKITAPPNSYFQIVVEQQGSTLSAELFDPQENSLIKIESV